MNPMREGMGEGWLPLPFLVPTASDPVYARKRIHALPSSEKSPSNPIPAIGVAVFGSRARATVLC